MGKRKVNILEPAATAVAEIAYFIEGEGLPQTAKRFVDEIFFSLRNLPMRELSINPVGTGDGETSVIVAFRAKRNMSLPISARKKKS